MKLEQFLKRCEFKIKGNGKHTVYKFIDFSHKYEYPLQLKKATDDENNQYCFFGFDDLEISNVAISNLEIAILKNKINTKSDFYKKLEEQRRKEWLDLVTQLLSIKTSLENLNFDIEYMPIKLINKKIKRICESIDYKDFE